MTSSPQRLMQSLHTLAFGASTANTSGETLTVTASSPSTADERQSRRSSNFFEQGNGGLRLAQVPEALDDSSVPQGWPSPADMANQAAMMQALQQQVQTLSSLLLADTRLQPSRPLLSPQETYPTPATTAMQTPHGRASTAPPDRQSSGSWMELPSNLSAAMGLATAPSLLHEVARFAGGAGDLSRFIIEVLEAFAAAEGDGDNSTLSQKTKVSLVRGRLEGAARDFLRSVTLPDSVSTLFAQLRRRFPLPHGDGQAWRDLFAPRTWGPALATYGEQRLQLTRQTRAHLLQAAMIPPSPGPEEQQYYYLYQFLGTGARTWPQLLEQGLQASSSCNNARLREVEAALPPTWFLMSEVWQGREAIFALRNALLETHIRTMVPPVSASALVLTAAAPASDVSTPRPAPVRRIPAYFGDPALLDDPVEQQQVTHRNRMEWQQRMAAQHCFKCSMTQKAELQARGQFLHYSQCPHHSSPAHGRLRGPRGVGGAERDSTLPAASGPAAALPATS
jgi:hypothetical protein